jgi:hypothetical protein
MANAILGGYVTALDRNFYAILEKTSLELVREIPLGFGGLYLLYLLRKPCEVRGQVGAARSGRLDPPTGR